MMAACMLLSATLKIDGALTMQVQGDGPISLMVVEATARRTLRGMAQWDDPVPEGDLHARFGHGRLVLTIDPGAERERYQGIVALAGDSLADALDEYLERSEQLPTRMWLGADGEKAAGLLLQKLPDEEEPDADAWDRAVHLGSTVTGEELLELHSRELIHRLFHEEDIRVFDSDPVAFYCSCSRERVAGMLRSLGAEEINSILAERAEILVHCEFCNQAYEFDRVDAEQLFHGEETPPEVPPTRH